MFVFFIIVWRKHGAHTSGDMCVCSFVFESVKQVLFPGIVFMFGDSMVHVHVDT